MAKVARFFVLMMKNWSWKAILGGVAVDILGTQVITVLLMIPVGIWLATRGMRPEDVAVLLTTSLAFLVPMMALGLAMSTLGGYLAAKWADTNKIAHAVIVGVLSLVLGLAMGGLGTQEMPLWFRLSSLLVVPAALLGGWWCVKTHGAESKIAPPRDSSSGTPPIAAP